MNEKDYKDKMDEALKHAEDVKQKQEIKEIKHSNDKPLSFSKIAVIFIFANCLVIELYSMVVMAIFHDLSSLGSLVMAVIGQCVTVLGYFIKSKAENCSDGIVYETAMRQYEIQEKKEEPKLVIEPDPVVDEDDGAVG